MNVSYRHRPHPRVAARQAETPVKVADQHAQGSAAQRFNARLAVLTTKAVGSMWCAYIFAAYVLLALPEAIKGGIYGMVQWGASFFLQLVLLSIIMVGQDVQARAADARSEQTYKDAEAVLAEALEIQKHLQAQDEILTRLMGG